MNTVSNPATMESFPVVITLFSLLSLGQAAPTTDCESLTQTIQITGRDQLLGRWNYMAESTDIPASRVMSKLLGTVWWNFTAATEENLIIAFQNQKMLGTCFTLTYNMTLENNALLLVHPYPSTAFLLNTGCADCIVVYSNYTIGQSSYRGLQFLSRRPKVSAAELAEYKKQVECLSLPSSTILDTETGFCPDPSLSKNSNSIDLTSAINSLGSDDMNLMDKIFRSDTGLKLLTGALSRISSTLTGTGN